MSTRPTRRLKTRAEVREWFLRSGISMAAWARAHDVHVSTVRMVLSGRPALRGDSHKVAVLLGLKTGRVDVTATDLVVPGMRKAA